MLDRLEKYEHLAWWPFNEYESVDDIDQKPWREPVEERLVEGESVRYGIDLDDGKMGLNMTLKARLFLTDARIIWVKRGYTSIDIDTYQLDAINNVDYDRGYKNGTIKLSGSGISETFESRRQLAERFATRADQAITEQQMNAD